MEQSFTRGDVRRELYDIRRQLEAERNAHIAREWTGAKDHEARHCEVCWLYQGRIQAMERTLRRFGGAVRRKA